MKMGHTFHESHGFTGSTGEKDMMPKIPGYKHGGRAKVEHGKHHHGDHPKSKGHKHGGMMMKMPKED